MSDVNPEVEQLKNQVQELETELQLVRSQLATAVRRATTPEFAVAAVQNDKLEVAMRKALFLLQSRCDVDGAVFELTAALGDQVSVKEPLKVPVW